MRTTLLALLFAALSPVASAAELAGVTVADTATVADQSLPLRGAGLRKFLMIKVYVAGLYTTEKGSADAVIRSAAPKTVRMHMMMDLNAEKIGSSIEDGFKRNSAAQMGALQARLDKLKAMVPACKKGDVIELAWDGSKTDILVNGKSLGTLDGADFAQALFAVWLGADPVTEELKAGMLGG